MSEWKKKPELRVRTSPNLTTVSSSLLPSPNESQGNSSTQLHDFSGVQISNAEATRLDSEATTYLLSNRKLALIVDLDQTIIHATVDPTVGEWIGDKSNPNHDALRTVGKFRLGTDGKAIRDDAVISNSSSSSSSSTNHPPDRKPQHAAATDEGCWYYVKPRPGLEAFLADLSTKYEMYVYTMGTRSYAESVCRLVDPKGSIFGARILSRDENGSLLQKSLKKLFPMDTSMVVIIDDRADVWKWSPHLVKVIPFDFFVGIGDINASFLPAASSETAPSSAPGESETAKEGEKGADSEAKTADEKEEGAKTVSSGATDQGQASQEEEKAAAVAEKSQREAVSEQLGSRPLAKMQEALDDNKEKGTPAEQAARRSSAAVLHDDDNELERLQEILSQIHIRWYSEWEKTQAKEIKPATTSIISALKAAVLSSCTVVFSSVIPLQQAPETSDLWRLASSFGATCKTEIDSTVTHLIAAKPFTQKVMLARERGIAVVWPAWLHDSCAAWYRQPEATYMLPIPSSLAAPFSEAGGSSTDSENVLSSFDSDISPDGLKFGVTSTGEDEEEDDEEQGFGEMNWDEANDEVDAVLDGLTDDEDTNDETGGYTTDASNSGDIRKRPRSTGSSNNSEDGDANEPTEEPKTATLSPLSKRRRVAEMRVGQSGLKNEIPVEAKNGHSSVVLLSKEDSGYADNKSEGGNTDDDFLRSLEDELELQLGGEEEADGDEGEEAAAVPSDDE